MSCRNCEHILSDRLTALAGVDAVNVDHTADEIVGGSTAFAWLAKTHGGLYRTTDSGDDWNKVGVRGAEHALHSIGDADWPLSATSAATPTGRCRRPLRRRRLAVVGDLCDDADWPDDPVRTPSMKTGVLHRRR